LIEVTPAERAAYDTLCSETVKDLGRAELPDTHYTTGETFIKIVSGGEVWSTQVACLNDNTEFAYAVDLFRTAIQRVEAQVADSDGKWFCDKLDGWLQYNGQDISEFFVFCMSAARDDLSQWRAYGGGEGGFSIGLDARAVAEWCHSDGGVLMPVFYDRESQERVITALAQGTVGFFINGRKARPSVDREEWTAEFLNVWRDNIVYLAPLLKDPAFQAEQEWRVVRALRPNDHCRMQFLQRRAFLSRHLPLKLSDDSCLPIKEVIVGPCRYKRISLIGAGDLLRSRNYDIGNRVKLSESCVPFQMT
jgi:hypothetical protein